MGGSRGFGVDPVKARDDLEEFNCFIVKEAFFEKFKAAVVVTWGGVVYGHGQLCGDVINPFYNTVKFRMKAVF